MYLEPTKRVWYMETLFYFCWTKSETEENVFFPRSTLQFFYILWASPSYGPERIWVAQWHRHFPV